MRRPHRNSDPWSADFRQLVGRRKRLADESSEPHRRIRDCFRGRHACECGRSYAELAKFAGDQAFFERGLDGVDVVLHGRHSHEQQRNSDLRRRLILTRKVSSIASDPKNGNALFWNPAGATLEQALAVLGKPNDRIGVIGGTEVFGIFLDRYDIFFLTRAPGVRLPGGRPVFREVPARTPEDVLARHGLKPEPPQLLDVKNAVAVVKWHRSSNTK